MNWVVREYGNAQSIPTAVLLSYLRQELQVLPWRQFGLMSTVLAGSPCHLSLFSCVSASTLVTSGGVTTACWSRLVELSSWQLTITCIQPLLCFSLR